MNHWTIAYGFLAIACLTLVIGGQLYRKDNPTKWTDNDGAVQVGCFLLFVLFVFIAIGNWKD